MPEIELLNEDCLEVMARYPDNHFDLAITSPPYNMKLRTNSDLSGYCSRGDGTELQKKYTSFADDLPMKEYEQFLVKTVSELCRVSKLCFLNIQMITGNKPALFGMMGYFKSQIKEVIIWDKEVAQPAMNQGTLNSRFEFLIVFGDTPITRQFSNCRFDRGCLDNVWSIKRGNETHDNHSAAFPSALPKTILHNFSATGNKIIDPFMGMGTTAIAAHYYGVDFVGVEIDEDYFKAAKERIYRETRQIDLFQVSA